MSQEHKDESQQQSNSADPLSAKPDHAVLDQYLDTVPMDSLAEPVPEDASLEDYADKCVEDVTEPQSETTEEPETESADAVDELVQEAEAQGTETEDTPKDTAEETPEPEIELVEDSQKEPTDQDSEEIGLVEDDSPEPPAQETPTQVTSHPDDALATQTTVDSVVEAVLFACDEPVTVAKLAGIVECTPKQVRQSVEALNDQYKTHNRAFRIEQIAGGLQMLTLPYYDHWLRKMIKVRADNKLTPAALETLAIVAYKQPVIRADIEAIRGVASGEMLRGLMVKGLVKMVGRAEVVGRPMQYGTTKKFLECFGLNTLKDLPEIEELKRPRENPEVEEEDE